MWILIAAVSYSYKLQENIVEYRDDFLGSFTIIEFSYIF